MEQIINFRNNLQYLGVSIHQKNHMFGDKKYVVGSAIHPHSKIKKRHTELSFYRVCNDIAYKMVDFYYVYGGDNPSDILSKYWSYTKVWGLLQTLLFWMGDTTDLLNLELKRDNGQEKGEWQKLGRFSHL